MHNTQSNIMLSLLVSLLIKCMHISDYSLVVEHNFQGLLEDAPTISPLCIGFSIIRGTVPIISSTVSIHHMYSNGKRRAVLFNKADQRQRLSGFAIGYMLCTTAGRFACNMSHCGTGECWCLISSIRWLTWELNTIHFYCFRRSSVVLYMTQKSRKSKDTQHLGNLH